MDLNYFQEKIMKYVEIGIVLEDFNYKEKGKIFIPILLPETTRTAPVRNKAIKVPTNNILNRTGVNGISTPEISNYVELSVPLYIGESLKDENDIIKKDTVFLITFVGGEINHPRIIGVD